MIPIDIRPNLEVAPFDVGIRDAVPGLIECIGLLPNGTAKGRPAVVIVVRLDDGTPVVAQTTWALLRTAVRALDASPIAELDRMENP